MQYRNLGRTGLKVSTICLGTMQFGWTTDASTSFEIMSSAVDMGCNFFDTANIYSNWAEGNPGGVSEKIIGDWLAKSSVSRSDLVIATKVRGKMGSGPNDQGLSRFHILNEVENSLRRLGTDYIDLYQVHSPDDETPLEETLRTLDDLIRWGKVRYVGCSNYPAWLLAKSLWISDVKGLCQFDSLQPKYSYVHRAEFERELQALCVDQGVGVIPYSPLGGGFLTGKYRPGGNMPVSERAGGVQRRYMNNWGFKALEELEAVGNQIGASIAQTAIAWVLANPAVSSAIIGANSLEQLADTIKGSNVILSTTAKAILDEATAWA